MLYFSRHFESGKESKAPDDQVFKHLSLEYAKHNPNMSQGNACPHDEVFPQGITNGAYWYNVDGLYFVSLYFFFSNLKCFFLFTWTHVTCFI